jgi:hypothetical protein
MFLSPTTRLRCLNGGYGNSLRGVIILVSALRGIHRSRGRALVRHKNSNGFISMG